MAVKPFNDAAYNDYLREEKLMGCRCRQCGSRFVPPRPLCAMCFGSDLEWIEVKGNGRLAAFTCIFITTPTMIAQGYGRKNPYISGVVELENGCRVDARIEGLDPSQPDLIRIGMAMKVEFIRNHSPEIPEVYLAFRPHQNEPPVG